MIYSLLQGWEAYSPVSGHSLKFSSLWTVGSVLVGWRWWYFFNAVVLSVYVTYQIYLKVLSKEGVQHVGLMPRTLQFFVPVWESYSH